MKELKNLIINTYADKHFTQGRGVTHFYGSRGDLLARVRKNWGSSKQSDQTKADVRVVLIDPAGADCPIHTLKEGETWECRFEVREGAEGTTNEEPRKICSANFERDPAKILAVICYSSVVLSQDNPACNQQPAEEGNYEIISINGSLTENDPMSPETLMANHFGLSGGTKTGMSAEDFVEVLRKSVLCHKDKINVD